MSRFNTLVVSAVPSTVQAFREFFHNDDTIELTHRCYSDIIDNPDFISEKYKVVIMDDGAATAQEQNEIKKYLTGQVRQRIILLTSSLDKSYLDFLIYNGVEGIISKRAEMKVIKEGIISVSKSKPFLCNIIKGVVFNSTPFINIPKLSLREKEIICRIKERKSNKEIANELFLSTRTVETYKQRIKKKFNLNSVEEILFITFWNILSVVIPLLFIVSDALT